MIDIEVVTKTQKEDNQDHSWKFHAVAPDSKMLKKQIKKKMVSSSASTCMCPLHVRGRSLTSNTTHARTKGKKHVTLAFAPLLDLLLVLVLLLLGCPPACPLLLLLLLLFLLLLHDRAQVVCPHPRHGGLHDGQLYCVSGEMRRKQHRTRQYGELDELHTSNPRGP